MSKEFRAEVLENLIKLQATKIALQTSVGSRTYTQARLVFRIESLRQ